MGGGIPGSRGPEVRGIQREEVRAMVSAKTHRDAYFVQPGEGGHSGRAAISQGWTAIE